MPVRELRVLVLGAGGGAGRAVAVQCALERCQRLILVNRTLAKVEALKQELSDHGAIEVASWEDSALAEAVSNADLIINGTSLGMKPEDAPLLPPSVLTSRHLVFDMVYRAGGLRTQLGEAAVAAGARYADGVLLLLHQGAISFEHWFDRPAPLEVMRAGLTNALRS